MSFNHYAKIKEILRKQPEGWYIKKINEKTSAKNFKGEVISYSHYYRVYSKNNEPIKFCKFQQLDRFLKTLNIKEDEVKIIL